MKKVNNLFKKVALATFLFGFQIAVNAQTSVGGAEISKGLAEIQSIALLAIKVAIAVGGIFCVAKMIKGDEESKKYGVGLVVAIITFGLIQLVVK